MKPYVVSLGLILLLAAGSSSAGQWYGESLPEPVEAVSTATVMANVAEWEDKPLIISGRITDVCSHRGCWAVFEEDGEMLRVTARDHEFALPADARGMAVAHGVLRKVEDDSDDPETMETPYQYRLEAEGVRLQP